jgi:hypothetical protein
MRKHEWRIRLRPHLSEDQLNTSVYDIADELGLSKTTVYRFMQTDEVITNKLSPNVAMLAEYFGLTLIDVVSVIVDEDEDEGIIKEALSA